MRQYPPQVAASINNSGSSFLLAKSIKKRGLPLLPFCAIFVSHTWMIFAATFCASFQSLSALLVSTAYIGNVVL